MIRVTVELLPLGFEKGKKTLGVLEIANDCSGTREIGNYIGTLHAEYTNSEGKKGYVKSFSRKTQSVWSLVGAFLKLFGHTKHSPKLMFKDENINTEAEAIIDSTFNFPKEKEA